MSFQPSRYSYDGWVDDAIAKAEAYKAIVDVNLMAAEQALKQKATTTAQTALAPVSSAASSVQGAADSAAAAADAAAAAASKTATAIAWFVGGTLVLGALAGGWWAYSRRGGIRNPMDAHDVARWLTLGGAAAGATGIAMTGAGAATLQPEVLALSGPLMVGGTALLGIGAAVDEFGRKGGSRRAA